MNALAQPLIETPVKQTHEVRTAETCHGCGSLFRRASQLWSCLKCGRVRVWGENKPDGHARSLLPLLNCDGCADTRRHGFIGVAGR